MLNQWSQDTYIKAYRFAAKAHNEQLVPGSDLPYIMHLSFVSMEVLAALAVEPVTRPDLAVQCALLHDTIEDTDVTHDDLQATFGNDVADGVSVCFANLTKWPNLSIHEVLKEIIASRTFAASIFFS